MPDQQGPILENKLVGIPQEPQIEKGGQYQKITAEELDFMHSFTGGAVSSGGLRRLKDENPQGAKRYEEINVRRVRELREIVPPELSRFHQEGYSDTGRKKSGERMQVSFEEMNNSLQEVTNWMTEWDGLNPEQKLARYNRIEELRLIRNIPEEEIPKEKYKADIAQMEIGEKRLIQDMEQRVRGLDSSEYDELRQFFGGNRPTLQGAIERWNLLRGTDPDQYKRLQKIQNRFQSELASKEPPFTAEPSHFYDGIPVAINGMRSKEIGKMNLHALKAVLQRSEVFAEGWENLSDEDRIAQFNRVRRLKGGVPMEDQAYVRIYLKDGETIEGKGIESWTSSIKGQIQGLQDAITAKEAQEQQQALEPTRAAIEEEDSHKQAELAPQEKPQTPPPAPKKGLLGRLLGKK